MCLSLSVHGFPLRDKKCLLSPTQGGCSSQRWDIKASEASLRISLTCILWCCCVWDSNTLSMGIPGKSTPASERFQLKPSLSAPCNQGSIQTATLGPQPAAAPGGKDFKFHFVPKCKYPPSNQTPFLKRTLLIC